MRRRARVDRNHAEIVDALRAIGCSVQSLASIGRGCPDLLVGSHGRNYLLEVKAPKGSETPDQVEWHKGWRGTRMIVTTPEQAIELLTLLQR